MTNLLESALANEFPFIQRDLAIECQDGWYPVWKGGRPIRMALRQFCRMPTTVRKRSPSRRSTGSYTAHRNWIF